MPFLKAFSGTRDMWFLLNFMGLRVNVDGDEPGMILTYRDYQPEEFVVFVINQINLKDNDLDESTTNIS